MTVRRPGFRTSEFIAAVVNAIVQVALAYNDTISGRSAVQYGVYGAVAFIISRGLAKYELRPPVACSHPPPAPAPPQV